MSLPKFRWLLPIGHFAVDGIVLLLWIWLANGLLTHQQKSQLRFPVAKPVLFLQENSVTFDVRDIEPDPIFLFLTSGNVPVAIVSEAARPRAAIQNLKRLWDPI